MLKQDEDLYRWLFSTMGCDGANYRMKTTCVFLSTVENDYMWTCQESVGRGTCHVCILMNIFVYDWCNYGIMGDSSCDWFCLLFRVSNISYLSVWNVPWSSPGKVSGRVLLILLFDGVFFAWRKISIYQPISYTPRFVGSRRQFNVLVYHLTPH